MAKELIWSKYALKDLNGISEYISRDSPRYATSFVHKIMEIAKSLKTLSERGRIVPELEDKDDTFRELILGSYRLIYRITPTQIRILGIIHGSRDMNKI